ncbi:NADH:flavin oxidoreductase [Sphingopyxis sp.]|uniref:NADH:flavin oxidoreductase n=1 Tax=Sphingopyxis sp. TaxID=1908224 RepID=UPI003BA987CA
MASLGEIPTSVATEAPTSPRSTAPLFRPFSLKSLELKNRIVMAPMTRYFSPSGTPGDDVARYYRRRAEGGCGLIITEGTTIETRDAGGYKAVPHFWGAAALEGWRRVADEVHAGGAKIIPQLWHVGLQRDPAICPDPELVGVGPSGLNRQFETVRDPATPAEIQEIVDAFARGAAAAIETGFDGVQLHGAHGYLIDQFLWARTNLRDDEFGGSIERRARFAIQVVEAVRREVGPDFPLLLRISQWKGHDYAAKLEDAPERLRQLLAPIAAAGVDMFDCSQRRFWEAEYAGSTLNLAGWVKELTGVPTITVGSVSLDRDFIGGVLRAETAGTGDLGRIDELVDRLAREEFDLVAVGRALLSDPSWPEKIRASRFDELQPFDPAILATLE